MHNRRALGRIVITGANGFIGRRLAERLSGRRLEVKPWVRPQVDLLSAPSIIAAAARDAPDTVFHLAASGVSASNAHDPAVMFAEIRMMAGLIAHLREGTRLLYAGTMSEYGRAGLLAENDPCTPATAYGIGKLAAGQYAAAYAQAHGIHFSNCRLFGVYGPGEAPGRFFPFLLSRLQRGEQVPLSDGRQRRDFVHVDDVCDALLALAQLPEAPPIVNIGTGTAVAISDVARWVADAAGAPQSLLRFGERPRSPGDEDLMQADNTLLTSLIGEAPPQRLKSGLPLSLISTS